MLAVIRQKDTALNSIKGWRYFIGGIGEIAVIRPQLLADLEPETIANSAVECDGTKAALVCVSQVTIWAMLPFRKASTTLFDILTP